jgi:hypothetical protein
MFALYVLHGIRGEQNYNSKKKKKPKLCGVRRRRHFCAYEIRRSSSHSPIELSRSLLLRRSIARSVFFRLRRATAATSSRVRYSTRLRVHCPALIRADHVPRTWRWTWKIARFRDGDLTAGYRTMLGLLAIFFLINALDPCKRATIIRRLRPCGRNHLNSTTFNFNILFRSQRLLLHVTTLPWLLVSDPRSPSRPGTTPSGWPSRCVLRILCTRLSVSAQSEGQSRTEALDPSISSRLGPASYIGAIIPEKRSTSDHNSTLLLHNS